MESDAGHLPLSHQAWAWFIANKKPTLWGAGIILVVGVMISYFLYRQDQEDIAASEALTNASMLQASAAGSRVDPAEAYLKVVATYPKTRAASRALLLAGGSLFVEGKYADAKAQFERFKRDYPNSPFVTEALLGIAACLEAQNQTREAMAAYKDVIDRHPGASNVPDAKFALGRLAEAQNEPEQARNLFEDVERAVPYGSLGDEARMRLEDLKTQYPKLFAPVTPPPTNALPLKMEKR